jgi:hypothetical protein
VIYSSNKTILIPLASNQHTCMTYTYCWTPDDGQKTCPKHIEFYSKNKFEKLVHPVGSIIRKYHCHHNKSFENSSITVIHSNSEVFKSFSILHLNIISVGYISHES